MLQRLSEAITNAGIPLERIEGTAASPVLVFQATATEQQQTQAAGIVAAFDSSEATHAAWQNVKDRAIATGVIEASNIEGKALRAIVAVLVDEINTLRQWMTDFKAQVALASNLADLKTRVATLPNTPARTLTQARTAITNKLEAGTVDN